MKALYTYSLVPITRYSCRFVYKQLVVVFLLLLIQLDTSLRQFTCSQLIDLHTKHSMHLRYLYMKSHLNLEFRRKSRVHSIVCSIIKAQCFHEFYFCAQ